MRVWVLLNEETMRVVGVFHTRLGAYEAQHSLPKTRYYQVLESTLK